jgi:hypothetical protein
VFFILLKGHFIYSISVDSFFGGFLYLCSTLLSCLVLSSLFHIPLFIVSFVSLWCLLKSSLSSFSHFCVFSWCLFVVS